MQDDPYRKSTDPAPSLFQDATNNINITVPAARLQLSSLAPVVMLHDPTTHGIEVHKIRVTFFAKNSETKKPIVRYFTLPQLCANIHAKPPRRTKDDLPLLKLAGFGKRPNEKGSLRHDGNVDDINGGELDYDYKKEGTIRKISFEEATEIIRQMRVRTLIYTSPSHTAAEPRWRLLIPLSKIEPDIAMRARLVATSGLPRGSLITLLRGASRRWGHKRIYLLTS